jgi:hypothetical protein
VDSGTTARALRAALFAFVCVGAGTALHRWADGCPPGTAGPALALPVTWLAAFGLARRERSPLFVTGALAAGQLCLHLELGWFCPPCAGPGSTPEPPGMSAMAGMPGTGDGPTPGHGMAAMVCAHVAAVLICGWWLGRGERCFFELCRAVALLAGPAADLLRGCLAADGAVPPAPARRGIHVTAPHTSSPSQGPAPGPKPVRGPPIPARLPKQEVSPDTT